MSQRRQEARRARQDRERELKHERRTTQRRTTVVAPARTAAPPPKTTFWTTRNKWILVGGIVAVVAVLAGIYVWRSATAPLPGVGFESQGNAHLADPDEPHEPYNSNPPTSGPHLPAIPRPGIYTQPKRAEDLGHFMEHGGVWVLYNCPDGCPDDVKALTDMVNKAIDKNYPVALAPFPTSDHKFALAAWQRLLTLDDLNINAMNDFINRLHCNYNPEGGPYCSGVKGSVKNADQNRPMDLSVTATPFSVFSGQTPAPSPAPTSTPQP